VRGAVVLKLIMGMFVLGCRLDKALDEAQAKGWTVVDMKNDWKTIFPFEKR
jgi:hypothetical protein